MRAVRRVAQHGFAAGRPDIAVDIHPEPVKFPVRTGREQRRLAEALAVLPNRIGVDGRRNRAAGIGHVEQAFVRREREAIRPISIVEHLCEGAGFRIEPEEVAGVKLLSGTDALVIAVDAIGRIGEPDRAIRLHDEIIRGIQAFALEPVRQHGDRAVVLGAGDAARQVLAGDEAALSVHGVAVRIIRGQAEHRNRTVGFVEPHHPVVGNVGPDEIAPGREIGRAFRPAAAGPEVFEFRMANDERLEARVMVDRGWQVVAHHASGASASGGRIHQQLHIECNDNRRDHACEDGKP